VLSHRACAVRALELHVQPALHLQKRRQHPQGDGARLRLLLRVHAALHAARAPADRQPRLERVRRHAHQHAAERLDRVPLPALRGLPQEPRHEQPRPEKAAGEAGCAINAWSSTMTTLW